MRASWFAAAADADADPVDGFSQPDGATGSMGVGRGATPAVSKAGRRADASADAAAPALLLTAGGRQTVGR